jgi:hypothetical protein
VPETKKRSKQKQTGLNTYKIQGKKYKMSIECKGRKKSKYFFLNYRKIKWRNKNPIEPRRLSKEKMVMKST